MFSQQPLYAPLAAYCAAVSAGDGPPDGDQLNRWAAAAGVVSGGGASLRFVVPGGSGLSYEERIYWLGEVETRPGVWHDSFNAMVWLAFPRSKAALNARHHHAAAAQQAGRGAPRGTLRDSLTQFDECGAIVVCSRLDLWQALCQHRWQEVFWTRRAETQEHLRVFVFGHASYDMLRTPHLGLCAKSLLLHVDSGWHQQTQAEQLADVDARVARRFAGDFSPRPRDLQPLPLLGVPGATPANECAEYYLDKRQFRALRLLQSPAEVRQAAAVDASPWRKVRAP